MKREAIDRAHTALAALVKMRVAGGDSTAQDKTLNEALDSLTPEEAYTFWREVRVKALTEGLEIIKKAVPVAAMTLPAALALLQQNHPHLDWRVEDDKIAVTYDGWSERDMDALHHARSLGVEIAETNIRSVAGLGPDARRRRARLDFDMLRARQEDRKRR